MRVSYSVRAFAYNLRSSLLFFWKSIFCACRNCFNNLREAVQSFFLSIVSSSTVFAFFAASSAAACLASAASFAAFFAAACLVSAAACLASAAACLASAASFAAFFAAACLVSAAACLASAAFFAFFCFSTVFCVSKVFLASSCVWSVLLSANALSLFLTDWIYSVCWGVSLYHIIYFARYILTGCLKKDNPQQGHYSPREHDNSAAM